MYYLAILFIVTALLVWQQVSVIAPAAKGDEE